MNIANRALTTHRVFLGIIFFLFSGCLVLQSGCVRHQPQEQARVTDGRPTLSFIMQNGNVGDAKSYSVYIDGQLIGSVADYLAPKSGLKVTSGTHLLRLMRHDELIMENKIYVSNGAVKEIPVP